MRMPVCRYQDSLEFLRMPLALFYDEQPEPAGVVPIDLADTGMAITVMTAWTFTDSPAVELVVDTTYRSTDGDGIVCPCGGLPTCIDCGGTGVYRGLGEAVVVATRTDEGLTITMLPYHRDGSKVKWDEPQDRSASTGRIRKLFDGCARVREKMPVRIPVRDQLRWLSDGYTVVMREEP